MPTNNFQTNYRAVPIETKPEKLSKNYILVKEDGNLVKGFVDKRGNWFYSGLHWHLNPVTNITNYLLPVGDSIVVTREEFVSQPSGEATEQAQAYVNNDSTIVGPRDEAIKLAYLAGAQSTLAEVKDLKERLHAMAKKYDLEACDGHVLRSKLKIAEKALKNIFDHTSGKSYLWAFEALDKIQEK